MKEEESQKKKVYKVDNVVIGSGVNAVMFAYLNNYTFISNEYRQPFRFDYFDAELDLSPFRVPSSEKVLQTETGQKRFGISKVNVNKHLLFGLSLAGLNPLSDKVLSVKIDGDMLNVVTARKVFVFQYDKLYIFDDANVFGLPDQVGAINEGLFKVIDWINIKSCTTHPYDYLETEGDFINEVYFYPSDRLDGHHTTIKDIVSVSYLTEEQVESHEYSDTYAAFKIKDMMKNLGIRGARNGRDMLDKTKYKYYALKIITDRREVLPLERALYQDTDKIEFMYDSPEDLIKKFSLERESYLYKITRKMDWKEHENRDGRI